MLRFFTVALLSGALFGQPAFEVASVKSNTSMEQRETGNTRDGKLTMLNEPMIVMVALAYGVSNDRVTGPDWIATERYDIVAKLPPDTTAESLWVMLRNLLVERFKLVVHREQMPTPVYALVMGRKKLTLQAVEASADGRPDSKCAVEGRQMTCHVQRMTMAQLAQNLPRWGSMNYFGRPVVDQTGLTGAYDFSVTWTPTNRVDDAVDPTGISLFDAIDQLGLKLEGRKVPLDRIVIDHMEKIPTEN